MSLLEALRIDYGLGGSYRQAVLLNAPDGWWRFAETTGHAFDSSGFGNHGTLAGSGVTRGVDSPVNEGGFAYSFDGANGYVTMGDVAAFEYTGGFAVEYWIKTSHSGSEQIIVGKMDGAGRGWRISMLATGEIRFLVGTTVPAFIISLDTAGAYNDDAWHYVAHIWDGSTGDVFTIVDDAIEAQTTALAGTAATPAEPFVIGAYTSSFALKFTGSLDEVAVYPALSVAQALAHYAAALWTEVTEDVWDDPALEFGWGIKGSGPTDRIGELDPAQCDLLNADCNSAGLEGLYSPGHANARAGFTRGIPMRIVATFDGDEYTLFTGSIDDIDPEPGRNQTHRVPVVHQDFFKNFSEADLREVALQTGKTETELLQVIVESLPVLAQPLAIDLDTGLDTSPYAFHDLGSGLKAIDPATDIVLSALAYLYVNRYGTLRSENRQYRQTQTTSAVTFDDDMTALEVPTDFDSIVTRFRLTIHPKAIDAAATTVLFAIPLASATQPSTLAINPGETVEYEGEYFNPSNVEQKIGGTAQVSPVATTDYLANAAADGSGTNKTAAVNVSAEFWGSSVRFTIENTDAAVVYVTKLQCRGKGLYDQSPVTLQAVTEDETVERPIDIDLPYQTDPNLAQQLADYLLTQYTTDDPKITSLTFCADLSDDFMLAALTLEVGDRITISETVTGVSTVDVFVQGVHFAVSRGRRVDVTLFVSPAVFASEFWILEDADSELGVNTFLAFA